ncbi:sugar phosphate isomerase/epimerase family protein [Candidatus Pelagibacter sp. HIMB1495]|uniref:sugar phosphate isomerase/epimerase family protein n=1 Tax=unclassified Candidatus Pelagibacter TaxID=2647897 RepID=UPI003F85568C
MKKKYGIMQGRLLPKYKGRYQAHPIGFWEDEFPIASKLGLDSIEFILDYNDASKNPLLAPGGIEKIKKIEKKSGVKVRSICADYFMEAPIHTNEKIIVDKSIKILEKLIRNASLLSVSDIVIPCVDKSSLGNKNYLNNFVKNIKSVIPLAESKNINLSLETDLSPSKFANLLDKIGSNNVTVNYDIGNSAAKGFDPLEEFNAYGKKITDVHVKDRLFGKGPVFLGKGDADIPKVFEILLKINYQGIIIFQAFRDNEGVEIFKSQFEWFKNHIKI